jgi:hypothetical protein
MFGAPSPSGWAAELSKTANRLDLLRDQHSRLPPELAGLPRVMTVTDFMANLSIETEPKTTVSKWYFRLHLVPLGHGRTAANWKGLA